MGNRYIFCHNAKQITTNGRVLVVERERALGPFFFCWNENPQELMGLKRYCVTIALMPKNTF